MIKHPKTTIPENQLQGACAALLLTLARDEPEALRRAAETLKGHSAVPAAAESDSPPAVQLARAYLAFTGNGGVPVPAADRQVFTFSHPAHVVFDVIGAGSVVAARRIARRSLAAIMESDDPVAGIDGPLPAEPAVSNVVVWLGSISQAEDALELEMVD